MACLSAVAFMLSTAGFGMRLPVAGVIALFIALTMGVSWVKLLRRISTRMRGGDQKIARDRIAAFLASHPDWRVRVYRTPAGLRLLARHRLFDPREPTVAACCATLGGGPIDKDTDAVRELHDLLCQAQRDIGIA